MRVISVDSEGTALVQFDNLECHTNVIGETAPIHAKVPVKYIAGMEHFGQLGREAAQRFIKNMADVPA